MSGTEHAPAGTKYFRDRGGRLFMLQAVDHAPARRSRQAQHAKHCSRLELHRLPRLARATTDDTGDASLVVRLDCFVEFVDPQAAACLVDLWIGHALRQRSTIDLMLDEWMRRLAPSLGAGTMLLGVAVLDLAEAPRAANGPRRYGHFTALPAGERTAFHVGDDEIGNWSSQSELTEVKAPGLARPRD